MGLIGFWILVFVIAIIALAKGADWLLTSAEKIGLSLGLSSFVVGVVIVGLGTSFPEIISSLFAILADAPTIVAANAVGSNVANILLVIGVSSLVAGRLVVTKNLIDLDLPLLAVTTVLFVGIAYDGQITQLESCFLFIGFAIYFAYTLLFKPDAEEDEDIAVLPTRKEERSRQALHSTESTNGIHPKVSLWDYILLVVGIIALAGGAKYLIDSVLELSSIFNISTGAITLAAVAVGTSLPELLVSAKAAWNKKSEVALGNIFGSNVFNLLFVVGLPGLFVVLPLDNETLTIGLPALVISTFLFIISGISRRVHIWEGAMYLLLYALFLGKLFGLL